MKRFILSIGLAASAAFAYANPVSVQTAQTVATNFIVSRGVGSNPSLQLTKSYTSTEASGQTSMYVFDVNNGKGFVIVSGDDAVMPILGYSTENIFPQQVTNNEVAYWMNGYNEQISNVIAHHVVASAAISADWSALINNTIEDNHTAAKPTDVAPMITTTWDQMNPFSSTGNSLYNNFCPTSTPTGCVATAMAQVMNFWQHPATGTGSHTYNSSTQGGTLTANFDTAYDWANMPAQLHNNSSATQKKAIALLMYNCGVAVEMDYDFADNGGSGAIVINYGSTTLPCSQNALKNYFGYSADIKGLKRSSYPVDSVWISKLRAELDAGRPLIYTGQGSVGGHAFDFDGYQTSTNMFHVNWGWSGNSNGYFTINNLAPPALGVGGGGGNFNSSQEALISIHPAAIEPNLVTNTGLTASQTSIAPGAAFTVTTTIKNTGTGDLTNGSLVGGVYDANGTTIVGYMQILSNQSLVAGATMPVTFSTTGISAMVPGNYIVRALYKENASDATWTIVGNGTSPNNVTIHVTDPTGINQLDDASMMKIFPNPASDLVTIDWGKFSGNVTGVQLFNILGQEVFHTETLTGTNIEIPVSNLNAGNYSMRIVTDKGTFAKKLLLNNEIERAYVYCFITVAGCTTGNSLEGQANKKETVMPQFTTGPATLVYKTKRDYGSFVPVLLSDDKSQVISYPDPKDLKAPYPMPTKLKDGYLLDNKGIGLNTAYLNLTYVQYAALPKVPSQEALMKMIMDKDPFTELYNCGNRNAYKNLVDDLNTLIRSGQFKKVCRQMK